MLALLTALGCQSPRMVAAVDIKQLMTAVLEPAAETYWDAVGSVDDSTGTSSFAPQSAEDWAAVRNSAVVLAESGNLLMMEGRAPDRGEWISLSRALVDAGKEAIAAATAQDTAAVFAAGANVYDACSRCHASYATQLVRPANQPR